VQRIPRIIAEMRASRETDRPAGFVPLPIARISEAMNVAAGAGCRGDGQVHRTSAATIASRENLTARRRRPEMAPQRVEKIESAPGNGMGSEPSKPQDVVDERAVDRALRPTKGWDGSGVRGKLFLPANPWKASKWNWNQPIVRFAPCPSRRTCDRLCPRLGEGRRAMRVAGRGPRKGTRGQKKAPKVLKSLDAKLKSAPAPDGGESLRP
jgi:hypothetical protein